MHTFIFIMHESKYKYNAKHAQNISKQNIINSRSKEQYSMKRKIRQRERNWPGMLQYHITILTKVIRKYISQLNYSKNEKSKYWAER